MITSITTNRAFIPIKLIDSEEYEKDATFYVSLQDPRPIRINSGMSFPSTYTEHKYHDICVNFLYINIILPFNQYLFYHFYILIN